jgi:glucan phosphorylase
MIYLPSGNRDDNTYIHTDLIKPAFALHINHVSPERNPSQITALTNAVHAKSWVSCAYVPTYLKTEHM